MKKMMKKRLMLSRETLRGLSSPQDLARVAGGTIGGGCGGSAGDECSGYYTSCRSQWPNCNFTATCPI
jgi:hypothetical protein